MKVFKDDNIVTETILGHLFKGDLFEKDCNNPHTTYMVVSLSGFQPTGMSDENDVFVVDLKNSLVRCFSVETKVIPLETDGLIVRETA